MIDRAFELDSFFFFVCLLNMAAESIAWFGSRLVNDRAKWSHSWPDVSCPMHVTNIPRLCQIGGSRERAIGAACKSSGWVIPAVAHRGSLVMR